MSDHDFYRPVERWQTQTIRLRDDRQRAIRLFCEQVAACWQLQIRTPMSVQGRAEGKHAIAACVSLTVEDMIALHDALNAMLDEAARRLGGEEGR